jgi:hypothetical protein
VLSIKSGRTAAASGWRSVRPRQHSWTFWIFTVIPDNQKQRAKAVQIQVSLFRSQVLMKPVLEIPLQAFNELWWKFGSGRHGLSVLSPFAAEISATIKKSLLKTEIKYFKKSGLG